MLQTINAIHNLSILYPSSYFGLLVLLASVLMPGWYKLGCLQAAAAYVSPAPISQIRSSRFVFYRRSTSIVLQVANLLILGSIESNNDTIVATIAVKVT
jgi:hypothetical protein